MQSLSDKIENHLKNLLAENSIIRIRRSKLAKKFDCVPSQINYVLDTRFTSKKGYIIESQRGGGGYIEITKVKLTSDEEIINEVYQSIGDQISQLGAMNLVDRLYESEIINSFERDLFKTIVDRKSIGLQFPIRDIVRARMLKNILQTLIKKGD